MYLTIIRNSLAPFIRIKSKCVYVPPSACMYVCLYASFGGGRGSLITNNYFDVFDVTHFKHKEILFEGKF